MADDDNNTYGNPMGDTGLTDDDMDIDRDMDVGFEDSDLEQ